MNERQYQNMCIYAVADAEQVEGFRLLLVPPEKKYWMCDEDVCLGETEVAYSPPPDMTREQMAIKAIETLKDKQKRVMAEAHMRCQSLQKMINQLALIGYDAGAADIDELTPGGEPWEA